MADNVDALSPLISRPAEDIVSRLLPKVLLGVQVLGMPSAGRRTIWLNLLERLSYCPSVDFINEIFGVVVLLQQSARLSERPVLSAIARRFVEWSWSYGETLPPDDAAQLASVVTGRMLPVVLATFDAELEKNNKFVRQILARIGNPRAATGELFWLSNDIEKIIEADPELAATVFRAVYSYTETSEAETRLGSGSVLNLVSNRKQDYESMRYALGVRFKLLIERDPILAASTAVWAVNAEVKRERPLNEGKSLEQISIKIKGYRTLSYTADYSEILKVMARSTVFRFKGKDDDPQKIGQQLQVSAVLMGRITQRGDEVGVQTDLVNTSDGSELWGAHYERKAADITQLQSDIARDISRRLRGAQLSGEKQQRLGSAGTTNSEAYRLYLEGRQLWPLVYDELRRVAHHYLQKERPGHTLQSTALVHEAYLREFNHEDADSQADSVNKCVL